MISKQLITEVKTLTRPELLELEALIQALLDESETGQEEQEPAPEASTTSQSNGRRGYIELKEINNCGPYQYLRWREGKKLRSRYIGKVKQA